MTMPDHLVPERGGLPKWKPPVFILILAAIAAGCLFLYHHTPEQTAYLPQCLFYKFTHLYCPGCGMTRALYKLVHGDFPGAIRCNLLFLPEAVLLSVLFWMPRVEYYRATTSCTMIIIIVYWSLRNLPFLPFTYLAPA